MVWLVIFALLMLSVLAYGLQNVLMAGLFRKHQLDVLVAMRGIGLGLVMAPLLIPVTGADWLALPGVWLPMLVACVGAMLANLSQAWAVRHLAVGIAYAFCMVSSTLLTVAYGIFLYEERPSTGMMICGAAVIALSCLLALTSSRQGPANGKAWVGIVAALCFAASMSSGLAGLTAASRHTSPYLTAWLWEFGIGLLMLLGIGCRSLIIPVKDLLNGPLWRRTALYASPTLIGTGCYTYAVSVGDLSLAAAIMTTVMVSSAIFARYISKEQLLTRQWVIMGLTAIAVFALEAMRKYGL